MKKVLFILLIALPVIASAEVPDSVWISLLDREIIITKIDGSKVQGTLIGMEEEAVTVMKDDGRIVAVIKSTAADVRVVIGGETPAAPPTAAPTTVEEDRDRPVGSYYFLANPLGFLQFGPVIELGIQAMPETMIGAHVRFAGLGLLAQLITAAEPGSTLSPISIAPGLSIVRLFRLGNSPDRFYVGSTFDFQINWTSGDDTTGEWTGSNALIVIMSNFGYRWRFPSRFFLNVGAFAGVGIWLWDEWYYILTPAVIYEEPTVIGFAWGLELSLGWELGGP